ncbi:MAG: hypothetical protein NC489_30420 [Ruminococcus flavefaciens]|nr:hypothetical protein [Ruminococcus flavefaciens]
MHNNKELIGFVDNKNTWYSKKNFKKILEYISYKYNCIPYKFKDNNYYPVPRKKVKKLIRKKCLEDFNIEVSYRQINALLKPQRGKFPYTAIIIIESIYNLLKEESDNENWKKELETYLYSSSATNEKYEVFLLGDIPSRIINRIDEYMNSPFDVMVKCLAESRKKYMKKIENIPMIDHCKRNFPSDKFVKGDVPDSMHKYQNRVYIYSATGRK